MREKRKRIGDAWEATRHALAVRSLLEIIGVWPFMIPVIVAVGAGFWAFLKGFALFMAGAISLGALLLMLWLPALAIYLARRSGRWKKEGDRIAMKKQAEWLKNRGGHPFKGGAR